MYAWGNTFEQLKIVCLSCFLHNKRSHTRLLQIWTTPFLHFINDPNSPVTSPKRALKT